MPGIYVSNCGEEVNRTEITWAFSCRVGGRDTDELLDELLYELLDELPDVS